MVVLAGIVIGVLIWLLGGLVVLWLFDRDPSGNERDWSDE